MYIFKDNFKAVGMSQLRDSAMARLPHTRFGLTGCHFVSFESAMKK